MTGKVTRKNKLSKKGQRKFQEEKMGNIYIYIYIYKRRSLRRNKRCSGKIHMVMSAFRKQREHARRLLKPSAMMQIQPICLCVERQAHVACMHV
jgi:hypothetical protein